MKTRRQCKTPESLGISKKIPAKTHIQELVFLYLERELGGRYVLMVVGGNLEGSTAKRVGSIKEEELLQAQNDGYFAVEESIFYADPEVIKSALISLKPKTSRRIAG